MAVSNKFYIQKQCHSKQAKATNHTTFKEEKVTSQVWTGANYKHAPGYGKKNANLYQHKNQCNDNKVQWDISKILDSDFWKE